MRILYLGRMGGEGITGIPQCHLEALAGIASIVGGANQVNQEKKITNAQLEQIKQQNELNKQQFNWTKEQADKALELELNNIGYNRGVDQFNRDLQLNEMGYNRGLTAEQMRRKDESASNYWKDLEQPGEFGDYVTRAEGELNPIYEETMKDTLENTNRGLMSRGFFGQAPGAMLTQEAASKVAKAKAEAVANRANQLYEGEQNRNLQAKQFGIGSFGTYGDVGESNIDTGLPIANINPELPDLSKQSTPADTNSGGIGTGIVEPIIKKSISYSSPMERGKDRRAFEPPEKDKFEPINGRPYDRYENNYNTYRKGG